MTSVRGGRWLLLCAALVGSGWALLGSDFSSVLVWWFTLFLIGTALFPVTQTILAGFHDHGYPFSKVIGVAMAAFLSWFAFSVRLLPLSRWAAVAILGFLAVAAFSSRKRRSDWATFFSEQKSSIARQEGLFLALLVFWAYIRGLRPDIHGLEKFMDYGFAASIARALSMPPQDMWFAGESINYYYFGHYVLAFLSELSGVPLSIAYNLMIATLLAFCFSLTLSLTAQLVRSWTGSSCRQYLLAGVVSAVLLTFGGNLHAFVFAYAAPLSQWLAPEISQPAEDYGYNEATRYIGYRPPTNDKTIHEFPFYSFVVSDLHGQVSNIPFVLTLLAILTTAFFESGGPSRALSFLGVSLALRFVLPVGAALAIFRMTNAWDLPIYLCVTIAVLFAKSVADARSFRQSAKDTVLTTSLILVICWLLTLPFNANFQNHYTELGWVHSRTPLHQVLVLWGVPLFFLLFYIFVVSTSTVRSKTNIKPILRHPLATFSTLPRGDQLVLVLILCAMGLVLAPELIYVRDIYAPEFYRANTYFKFTYQAYILFGVVLGFLAFRVFTNDGWLGRSHTVKIFCIFILLLPLSYPAIGVSGYYGSIHPSNFKGLDGLTFLDRDGRGDGRAVRWLNENVSGSSVVLEANGNSYSEFGRVSMATGLPTILGWYAHEWLWRGSRTAPERRAREVALVYESDDEEGTLAVLRKYEVRFILLGELERSKFQNLNEEKLLGLGDVVFDVAGTKIIRVHGRERTL